MAPGTVTLLGYMMRMMAWANILPMPFFCSFTEYVSRETYSVKHISRRISAIHSMNKKEVISYDTIKSVKLENGKKEVLVI